MEILNNINALIDRPAGARWGRFCWWVFWAR